MRIATIKILGYGTDCLVFVARDGNITNRYCTGTDRYNFEHEKVFSNGCYRIDGGDIIFRFLPSGAHTFEPWPVHLSRVL